MSSIAKSKRPHSNPYVLTNGDGYNVHCENPESSSLKWLFGTERLVVGQIRGMVRCGSKHVFALAYKARHGQFWHEKVLIVVADSDTVEAFSEELRRNPRFSYLADVATIIPCVFAGFKS